MSKKKVSTPPDLERRLGVIAIETTKFIAERVKEEFPDEGDFVPGYMTVIHIVYGASTQAFAERTGMTVEELHARALK